MTWPGAGSGADSCDCLFLRGGGHTHTRCHRCHLTAAGARCHGGGGGGVGGGSPRYRHRGLPGTVSVPSAWRYEAAGGPRDASGGGDAVTRVSRHLGCCLAPMAPVCQRLLSLPPARPFGFVVAFYFLFIPPPTLRTRPAGTHACAHTALPSAPQGTPGLCVATNWGVPLSPPPTCPILILPGCRELPRIFGW